MAVLSKETVQRLAVLRALSMWQRGAYGPLRLQKTMFFAEPSDGDEWHLFTFKKWRLGQYSDEIADTLNDLRDAGRITIAYDGPSERIRAEVPPSMKHRLRSFFWNYFNEWERGLRTAFREWAYLSNDDIIDKAHKDHSYTKAEHGEVILTSFEYLEVEFRGMSDDEAESLSDTVDATLCKQLSKRLAEAVERPIVAEDWRHIYFGEPRKQAASA